MQCYNCHTTIAIDRQPSRNQTCPKCAAYLRCCRNCRFYDPMAHNQCREPQAEWVKDKEMANFCDYFDAASEIKMNESSKREESLKKLNELFKKK
ncbi:MAG: hypothetical protein ACE5JB_10930 [bacterium]